MSLKSQKEINKTNKHAHIALMMDKHAFSNGYLSIYYSEILVSNKSLHFRKQSEIYLSDSGQNVGLVY